MYLILALGLLIYIMAVRGNEKANKKINDKEFRERQDAKYHAHDMFLKTYAASEELAEQMHDKAYSDDDDVLLIRDRISSEANVYPTYDMIILALIAQYGKIPKTAAYFGFQTLPYGMRCLEEERRFLVWYDKELRSHGVDHKLLFATRDCHYGLTEGEWVAECDTMATGVYFWEPIRVFAGSGDTIANQYHPALRPHVK